MQKTEQTHSVRLWSAERRSVIRAEPSTINLFANYSISNPAGRWPRHRRSVQKFKSNRIAKKSWRNECRVFIRANSIYTFLQHKKRKPATDSSPATITWLAYKYTIKYKVEKRRRWWLYGNLEKERLENAQNTKAGRNRGLMTTDTTKVKLNRPKEAKLRN